MPKGEITSNDVLNAVLRAVDPSWRGNASRYIALHTADPTASGNQTSSEANYTSYARVAVTAATGFTAASGGETDNTALIQFPQCTGGSNNISHVSIGTAATGTGQILYVGALSATLTVANLIQPQFNIGALVIQES